MCGPAAAFFSRNKTITLVFCEGHPVPRRDDRDTSSNISCLSEEAGKPTAAIHFNLNCHQLARPAATRPLLYTLSYLSPDYIIFFNMCGESGGAGEFQLRNRECRNEKIPSARLEVSGLNWSYDRRNCGDIAGRPTAGDKSGRRSSPVAIKETLNPFHFSVLLGLVRILSDCILQQLLTLKNETVF